MKKEEFQMEDLIAVLSECGLTELKYEKDNIKVKIKKAPTMKKVVEKKEVKKVEKDNKPVEKLEEIKSHSIGRFYFEKSNGDKLMSVGDKIKVGQELGFTLVMGTKTPLKSSIDGTIVEILVDNGGIIDFGKTLVKVRATAI